MATATAAARKASDIKEFNFTWVGKDKSNKIVRGEMKATGEAQVNATLRENRPAGISFRIQRASSGSEVPFRSALRVNTPS